MVSNLWITKVNSSLLELILFIFQWQTEKLSQDLGLGPGFNYMSALG